MFKTIPSDLTGWLKTQGTHKVAIVTDDNGFSQVNAASMDKAAKEAGLAVLEKAVVPKGTTDVTALLARLKEQGPDQIILTLGPSTAAFFHAYEQSGWSVPLSGRIDFQAAMKAASPAFLASGGLGR